ncbi:antibiotic biosynthesis monooxygenase [Taibaiella sp. KBW10]|uniref:putative quinol monooxygenase n=1 Tax=Taibaiella sp. KBW10 TaxID=2153357 RepID=UPI000F5A3656|nr:antibiotic biosynthesis monooxygenase family protein [Taibaiella sp. KBW10]RQO29644.1 antibiotic biosynthesis monooxygenase [Taibaiella sp. KBW10]
MIIRIVKMTFLPEGIPDFLSLFEARKSQIRSQEGCTHLELLKDLAQDNIYFTYSYWEDPKYLEQYRNSAFFADTWAKTKALFQDKAQAWSVVREVVLA